MGPETLSGGVVVALAATLWLAYLLPSWLRRREYLATERNAVRLQQTLRILAETAEVPEQVRVEATAREVAVQQRLLKKVEERALAEATARAEAEADRRSAELAAALAAQAEAEALIAEASIRAAHVAAESKTAAAQAALMDAPVASASSAADAARSRRRRIRRARAATSLALLAGLVFVAYGITSLLATGSWMFLAAGLGLAVAAVIVQARLARTGRTVRVPVRAVHPMPAVELYDDAEHDDIAEQTESVTWTPQPLPKPLYLSRGTIAASAMASVDAAKELRRAAAREDLDRRARELAPVAELRPRPAAAVPAVPATTSAPAASGTAGAAPSRFARMGVLEEVASESIDVDAVLRRRRAAS